MTTGWPRSENCNSSKRAPLLFAGPFERNLGLSPCRLKTRSYSERQRHSGVLRFCAVIRRKWRLMVWAHCRRNGHGRRTHTFAPQSLGWSRIHRHPLVAGLSIRNARRRRIRMQGMIRIFRIDNPLSAGVSGCVFSTMLHFRTDCRASSFWFAPSPLPSFSRLCHRRSARVIFAPVPSHMITLHHMSADQ